MTGENFADAVWKKRVENFKGHQLSKVSVLQTEKASWKCLLSGWIEIQKYFCFQNWLASQGWRTDLKNKKWASCHEIEREINCCSNWQWLLWANNLKRMNGYWFSGKLKSQRQSSYKMIHIQWLATYQITARQREDTRTYYRCRVMKKHEWPFVKCVSVLYLCTLDFLLLYKREARLFNNYSRNEV